MVETYSVFFFGADMPSVDSTVVTITIGPTDTLAAAKTKLIDAIMDASTALGYALVRTRVVVPSFERGS